MNKPTSNSMWGEGFLCGLGTAVAAWILPLLLFHNPPKKVFPPAPASIQTGQEIATLESPSDLVVIKREFYWLAADSLKTNPDLFCKKLVGDFGVILDENEIENYIDPFSPADSIPPKYKTLYRASTRYIREHCGQFARKWTGNENYNYYRRAVKFAVMSR